MRSPGTWPFAVVPALILAVLVSSFGAAAIWAVQPWLEGVIGPSHAWYARLGAGVVSWLGAAAAFVAGFLAALAMTPPLSGPALEQIVAAQEREIRAPKRAASSFSREVWCGLRAQVFAAIFVVPTLIVLGIVDFVFPPAAVVTVPLKMLVASVGMAWNLFDYPLTLRDVRMRDRFGFLMDHKRETLGFGLAFAALFWVPCFGVLMLPAGVAAATRLIWETLEADPSALPMLERPTAASSLDGDPDLPPQLEVPLARDEQE